MGDGRWSETPSFHLLLFDGGGGVVCAEGSKDYILLRVLISEIGFPKFLSHLNLWK